MKKKKYIFICFSIFHVLLVKYDAKLINSIYHFASEVYIIGWVINMVSLAQTEL